MVLQKQRVLQNFSPISRVSQSRFFSGYVRLAVSFFIRSKVSWSLDFLLGSRRPDSLVCFLNDVVFSSILTSPK